MGVFKTTNHVVRLRACTSCICSSYPPLRLLHSLTSFSLQLPNLSSSHPRFLSSDTHNSILMELVQKVAHRGATAPESIAIRYDKKSHTYQQLIASAKNVSTLLSGADLKSVNGTEKNTLLGGARVGIVAKPCPEFVAGVLGTWFSGGVAVPLALSYPEAELLHVMNDADITMILSTEDHQEIMKAVAAKTSAQLSLLPAVLSTGADHASLQENDVSQAIKGDDPALIIYTSGTTGKPKGVVHTHQGILAQVQMLTDAWGYTSDDQFLHSLPLHHIHIFVFFYS